MIKYDIYHVNGICYRVNLSKSWDVLAEYYNPYLDAFRTSGLTAAHVILHRKAVLVGRNVVFKVGRLCSQ
ncbi:hypothetical protein RCIP0106_00015 [Klebsiella phage RCIP0106]